MQEKEELQLLQLHVFLGPEDKNEFLYFNAWTAIFGICNIYQKHVSIHSYFTMMWTITRLSKATGNPTSTQNTIKTCPRQEDTLMISCTLPDNFKTEKQWAVLTK